MSNPNGPVRRRRIAGESGPATPAVKAPAKKPTAKKPLAKKAPAKKSPAKKSPVEKAATSKVSTSKAPVSKTPAEKTAAKTAPAKKTTPVKKASAAAPVVARPLARATTADQPAARAVPTRKSSPAAASRTEHEERAHGSRPARRDLVWLVPATLVAVAAMVVGVFFVIDPPGDGGGADLDSSRRQASSAAAIAAETIFTFRYDQLDQHLKASKALMTPAFSKEFDEIAPALTELAPQRNIVVQAVARDSAALPCGDECSSTKADVLVFVDQARLIGDSKEPTVFANRIKVSMVKGDDGWLVSNIRAL